MMTSWFQQQQVGMVSTLDTHGMVSTLDTHGMVSTPGTHGMVSTLDTHGMVSTPGTHGMVPHNIPGDDPYDVPYNTTGTVYDATYDDTQLSKCVKSFTLDDFETDMGQCDRIFDNMDEAVDTMALYDRCFANAVDKQHAKVQECLGGLPTASVEMCKDVYYRVEGLDDADFTWDFENKCNGYVHPAQKKREDSSIADVVNQASDAIAKAGPAMTPSDHPAQTRDPVVTQEKVAEVVKDAVEDLKVANKTASIAENTAKGAKAMAVAQQVQADQSTKDATREAQKAAQTGNAASIAAARALQKKAEATQKAAMVAAADAKRKEIEAAKKREEAALVAKTAAAAADALEKKQLAEIEKRRAVKAAAEADRARQDRERKQRELEEAQRKESEKAREAARKKAQEVATTEDSRMASCRTVFLDDFGKLMAGCHVSGGSHTVPATEGLEAKTFTINSDADANACFTTGQEHLIRKVLVCQRHPTTESFNLEKCHEGIDQLTDPFLKSNTTFLKQTCDRERDQMNEKRWPNMIAEVAAGNKQHGMQSCEVVLAKEYVIADRTSKGGDAKSREAHLRQGVDRVIANACFKEASAASRDSCRAHVDMLRKHISKKDLENMKDQCGENINPRIIAAEKRAGRIIERVTDPLLIECVKPFVGTDPKTGGVTDVANGKQAHFAIMKDKDGREHKNVVDMWGFMGSNVFKDWKQFKEQHKDVDTVRICSVPGTSDAAIAKKMAEDMKKMNVTMVAPYGAYAASFAVDLFTAGKERILTKDSTLYKGANICAHEGYSHGTGKASRREITLPDGTTKMREEPRYRGQLEWPHNKGVTSRDESIKNMVEEFNKPPEQRKPEAGMHTVDPVTGEKTSESTYEWGTKMWGMHRDVMDVYTGLWGKDVKGAAEFYHDTTMTADYNKCTSLKPEMLQKHGYATKVK
jgi:hypothetical protein